MKLDRLIESARSGAPSWDEARAARVLEGAVVEGTRRAERTRLARRSAGVIMSGGALVVLLVRGVASPAVAAPAPSVTEVQVQPGETVASHDELPTWSGDGGYGRD